MSNTQAVNNQNAVVVDNSTKKQVKEGYWQSPVGVIPVEWEAVQLVSLMDFKNGINYYKSQVGNGVKVIGVGDFSDNITITYNLLEKVDFDVKKNKEYLLKNGDFIFVRSNGNKALIGRSLYIVGLLEEVTHSGFTIRARWDSAAEGIVPLFYAYIFKSRVTQMQFLLFGGGTNIANLSQEILGNIWVPKPSEKEQRKIATILSSWDEAIEKTQAIVDRLKERNRGLAAELLSGRKRLEGGEGEAWQKLKADKIFKNYTDKSHEGRLEVLSATQEKGIIPRNQVEIDIKYDKNTLGSYKRVEKGDFVISLRSFQGGIEYSDYDGIVSPAYTVLKEIRPISKDFYKVYFKTQTFINKLNTIIYGIRDGKQIGYKDFSLLKLPYPSLKEQQTIAKVLIAANSELQLYQQKLTTLQEQKRGLMQVLLTGEKRVRV